MVEVGRESRFLFLDIIVPLIKIGLHVKKIDILPQRDLRLHRNWQDWLSTFQNQGSFPLNRDNSTIHNKSFVWQISFLLLPSRSQPSQIYLLSDRLFCLFFFLLLLACLWRHCCVLFHFVLVWAFFSFLYCSLNRALICSWSEKFHNINTVFSTG